MKSKEELNALKEEVESMSRKLTELNKEELEQIFGGDGKKRYDAKCKKCGSLVGGCGCFSYDEAVEKAALRGKYGCSHCGAKYCFEVVEV